MTEEIIKECKNCDALCIDSEIGVYYCCLSHRQDDLPKEFTCDDFIPNKQLKRLEFELKVTKADYEASEQENKELKEENKQHIKEKQILNKRLYCYAYEKDCHLVCKQQNCLLKNSYAYRSALEEIKEKIKSLNEDICNNCGWYNTDNCQPNGYVCHDLIEIKNKINEVLNEN